MWGHAPPASSQLCALHLGARRAEGGEGPALTHHSRAHQPAPRGAAPPYACVVECEAFGVGQGEQGQHHGAASTRRRRGLAHQPPNRNHPPFTTNCIACPRAAQLAAVTDPSVAIGRCALAGDATERAWTHTHGSQGKRGLSRCDQVWAQQTVRYLGHTGVPGRQPQRRHHLLHTVVPGKAHVPAHGTTFVAP